MENIKHKKHKQSKNYFDKNQLHLINSTNIDENEKIKELLDFFIEHLHNGLAITDGDGVFVRISESWEKEHGVLAKDIIGKNAFELEEQGIFRPSVTLAVIEKKRRIEMLQYNKNGEKILVSGIPIFDNKNGEIDWIISYSSWNISDSEGLRQKYNELKAMMKRYSTEIKELRKKDMEVPGIIAESPQMIAILDMISQIVSRDINVLITGETGVGKNLIAKNIHIASERNEAHL